MGCNCYGVFVHHVVYADDTVLLAPSPSELQQHIDHCVKFADGYVFYNVQKSKCMCYTEGHEKLVRSQDSFNDNR